LTDIAPYRDDIDGMIYNYNNNSSNRKKEGQNPRAPSTARGVSETLDALKQSQTGTHCIFVYPDLKTLRQILLHYTKVQLEGENQIVLILPYYESTDMIRQILSAEEEGKHNNNNNKNKNAGIDVRKYEKEGSLIIMDSLKGYFYYSQQQDGSSGVSLTDDDNNNDNNVDLMSFVEVLLRHAERRRKDGVTILADMGSFYHYYYHDDDNGNGTQRIINYEKSLPIKYDHDGMKLKAFCLYHQSDFEKRFTKKQQAKLLDSHSRSIMMMVANSD
jgi:hypothetical protein